jgi:hypothetical protein
MTASGPWARGNVLSVTIPTRLVAPDQRVLERGPSALEHTVFA